MVRTRVYKPASADLWVQNSSSSSNNDNLDVWIKIERKEDQKSQHVV